jgi:ABC1 atypical kinase-like domain
VRVRVLGYHADYGSFPAAASSSGRILRYRHGDGRCNSRCVPLLLQTGRLLILRSGWIKRFFPEFEFSWLGVSDLPYTKRASILTKLKDEMRVNLPKEMDFVNEAYNAQRTERDFADRRKTSLYIPQVVLATKRVLIMEYIEGGRVDDLEYLAKHNIDRNKVAVELSRIFSEMVFRNGWFHAVGVPACLFNALLKVIQGPPSWQPLDSTCETSFQITVQLRGLPAGPWLVFRP